MSYVSQCVQLNHVEYQLCSVSGAAVFLFHYEHVACGNSSLVQRKFQMSLISVSSSQVCLVMEYAECGSLYNCKS